MVNNEIKNVVFAGVSVTEHMKNMWATGHHHPSRKFQEDIDETIKELKELGKNQKVRDAWDKACRLWDASDEAQENDDTTYREVNFNITRNYRNLVVEVLVEEMDAFNEFIDFPAFQLMVINIAYEFDVESDDLK